MIDTLNITKEQLMQIADTDPRWIVERGFYVVNKDKEQVPFLFNDPQNLFYNERTPRDDILKAGQLGLSTEILGILTVKFLFIPNSWSVCISHEDEATKRLFEKVDFFLRTMRPWLKPFYQPGKTTEGDMVNRAMNSKFYIGTAGARAFGRGDTIHYAHLSETSRWKGQGQLMTGVIRAVPLNDPHTWIVKETTANGEGTMHHQEYQRAKANRQFHREVGGFVSHFIPFFSNPDYRIKDTKLIEKDLSEKETHLLRRFPQEKALQNKGYIDIPTLAWRRAQIAALPPEAGHTPEEIFAQEFPVDDTEAFLSTGNSVFSTEPLAAYKEKARECIMRGEIIGAMGEYNINETDNGRLQLWDMPSLDGAYIIFADVGQYSDYCVATVLDRRTWNMVAKFRVVMTAHAFGDELNKIGQFFNNALLAVEDNNMGQSTIDRLVDLKYPNMYMRQRTDDKTKKTSAVYGWHTSEKTKNQMIGHMQDIIIRQEVDIPDIDVLNEMTTFVLTETGAMQASSGNTDDQVISISGAYYILKLNPYTVPGSVSQVVRNRVQKFKKMRSASRLRSFRQ